MPAGDGFLFRPAGLTLRTVPFAVREKRLAPGREGDYNKQQVSLLNEVIVS